MSRYQVNKAMRQIALHPDDLQEFVADPAQYLGRFELNHDERGWLTAIDYRSLFLMGAHPFLLNSFAMAVARASGEGTDGRELQRRFKSTIAGLDNVDTTT